MPNIGRPSRDCHLCRARRVKCDLTRPSCQRCVKYGKDCPGYRQPLDMMFQNATPVTLEVSHGRPERKKAAASQMSVTRRGTDRKSTSGPVTSSYSALPPGHMSLTPLYHLIPETPGAHSVPLILEKYSFARNKNSIFSTGIPGHSYGYHDFLPRLLQDRENGCLGLTADAFAAAYLKNQSNDSFKLDHRAFGAYGKALKAVNESLRDPEKKLQDTTLAAVWLLGNYELMTASSTVIRSTWGLWKSSPEAWFMHAKGLASLLRSRGVEQLSTRMGRNLFWVTFSIVQTSCLIANESLLEESDMWLDTIGSNLQPQDMLPFLVGRYTYHATRLSVLINNILANTKSPKDLRADVILDIISQANLLDDTYTIESLPLGGDLNIQFWTIYRMAVIKLHHFLILLINYIEDGGTAVLPEEELTRLKLQRSSSLRRLRWMGQEVLDTAQMVFHELIFMANDSSLEDGGLTRSPRRKTLTCWADTLRMVGAITMVESIPSMRTEQNQEARDALIIIGTQFRIRQALAKYRLGIPIPVNTEWRVDKVAGIDVEGET